MPVLCAADRLVAGPRWTGSAPASLIQDGPRRSR